jgi:acyl-CoA thioesterase-2
MRQPPLDLSRVFQLEPHGPDAYVGESPPYPWGRIYGGLVVAQALWAATQTVRPEHAVHSLHAYFILGGDLGEPVRYEVDRVRNGRSFSTRRVVARQSGGAILTLGCSFQVDEGGPDAQSAVFPTDLPSPDSLAIDWDAGAQRLDVPVHEAPPRSRVWTRYPLPLGEDPRLHTCALAYLSDMNPMNAVSASHPVGIPDEAWDATVMAASLDHALWFHRPLRADDWLLIDLTGHGLIGSRGLATGPVFDASGSHVATIAQEALLRERRPKPGA